MWRALQMIAVLAFCLGFGSRPAQACGVCVELPEYSLADQILSARVIVLAAPSPDNPFRFTPVSIVKGTPEQVEALPEIPFLVDSVARSAFRVNPNRTVLMIYGAGYRDKAGRGLSSGWIKGFLMTPDRTQFLETLRAKGQGWVSGAPDRAAQVAFFSDYLTHEDRMLRNAALIEIHRAPYRLVTHLADAVPTAQLLQDLRNPNRLAYAPVLIRLLGLQSDPKANERVRLGYQSALRDRPLNLYDWGLAGIAVDRDQAILEIEKSLLRPDRTDEEKRNLIRSLVDGGTAYPETRPLILDVFKRQLDQDNSLAIWIALAVRPWDTSALIPTFEAVMAQDNLDPATLFFLQAVTEADERG